MKSQDVFFILVFLLLLYRNSPHSTVISGVLCLVVSIPLFGLWIFFTAERLTWYAASFFLLGAFQYLFILKRRNTL